MGISENTHLRARHERIADAKKILDCNINYEKAAVQIAVILEYFDCQGLQLIDKRVKELLGVTL